jgi:serine/threonine protein phosphatase PrpC
MPVPSKILSLNEIGGRKNNEDAIWPPLGQALLGHRLFLVCDGVGGNSKGEVASALTCKHFNGYFEQNLKNESQLDADFVSQGRDWVVTQFDNFIAEHPGAADMSTTLTLAYIKEKSIFLAWCGDSRIHLIRNCEIIFQSEDHSLVNELVKNGDITLEEAETHLHRNIITRSIQAKRPFSEIQTMEIFDIQDNDELLLCTDGLLEKINPEVLKEILSSKPESDHLDRFQEYCFQKTRDNYSMYLISLKNLNVSTDPQIVIPMPSLNKTKEKGWLTAIITLALMCAIALAGYYFGYFDAVLKR